LATSTKFYYVSNNPGEPIQEGIISLPIASAFNTIPLQLSYSGSSPNVVPGQIDAVDVPVPILGVIPRVTHSAFSTPEDRSTDEQ